MEKGNQETPQTEPKEIPKYETPEFLQACKKLDELGPLSLTAEDHRAIGSSPKENLKDNPEKTVAELMTDEEILKTLNYWKKTIEEEAQGLYVEHNALKSLAHEFSKRFKATILYLRSIGRLPKEFENFDTTSLEEKFAE